MVLYDDVDAAGGHTVTVGWPPIAREALPWSVSEAASKSQRRKHSGPYEAAVPPSIADLAIATAPAVTALADRATRLIADFDADITSSPGAEITPLATILLRTESASSSQIENLTVGARQLALAEIGESKNRNARIVRTNVDAMQAATALTTSIDLDSIARMHRVLLGETDEHAGRFRDQQVWIGGSDAGPHRAAFVPPHSSRVEPALLDLVRFIARDDLPALQQVAVAHAQFETVHPFTDGNGRTGRAIVHAMLRNKGVARHTTVPISAGLLADTDSYYAALTAYRAGQLEPIIEEFARATELSVVNGRTLVEELRETFTDWQAQIEHLRSDAAARRLAPLLISQPVVTTGYVRETLAVSVPAAQRAIDALVDQGILTQTTQGSRNRIWQSTEVLSALDDFGARIRRSRHTA